MSIVQLADVLTDMPSFRITDSPPSTVTATQVTAYIGEIESEVRATLEAVGYSWPVDGSNAASYMKRTILEGVRWMVLRAWFALSSPGDKGADIDRAYRSYSDRLNDVPSIARAAQNVTNNIHDQPPASTLPQVRRDHLDPSMAGSFSEYSQAREWVAESRSLRGWHGGRPWPLS